MADVVGWRIVKAKHASTAFSGEGARLFEGRWNSSGVRVVYCSEHLSLAALEILVHIVPVSLPGKFRIFRVLWSEDLMVSIRANQLPRGWNTQPPTQSSKQIGDNWVREGRSAVLAVPTVLVPFERTFLLNPQHPDFAKINISDRGNFEIDPRLRK